MTLIHLLIVLAVLAGVAAVAAGKVTGGLPEPTSTRPDIELVSDLGSDEAGGGIGTKDVDEVRFSVGFRGYRMDEVDDVLDRLGLELGAREEEIRELREQLAGGPEQLASGSEQLAGRPERSAEPEPDPDLPPAG